jgi:hypothetical protein
MPIPQDWTFFLWSSFIAGFGGQCPPYVLIEKTKVAFFSISCSAFSRL